MSNIFNRRPYTEKDAKDISDLIIPPGLTPETLRILPNIVLRVVSLSGETVEGFTLTTYGDPDELVEYPTLSSGSNVFANVRDSGTF